MGLSDELAALVDTLSEEHPTYRRTTIERLVLRTVQEMRRAGDVPLSGIQEAANRQLTYTDRS